MAQHIIIDYRAFDAFALSEWLDSFCPVTLLPSHLATLRDADFFGGEVVELIDEVADSGFEGLDGGGGIGLLASNSIVL